MFKIINIILYLLWLLLSQPLHSEPLDQVVAVINDDIITQSELEHALNETRQQRIARNAPIPNELLFRKAVLQHLIDIAIQLQLAKENNLSIDNTELNQAITQIAQTNHLSLEQLHLELQQRGLNWNDYRKNIRKEMLLSR